MDEEDICHCGLRLEDHYYGGPADHSFVPKDKDSDTPVFTHCNVCGIRLRDSDEYEMGMCIRCATETIDKVV